MDFIYNKSLAPMVVEKNQNPGGRFWDMYQLNSTANSAHSARFFGERAKLAVQFSSWQLRNRPQYFNFFNCPGCPILILCEIHCYICPPKNWHNDSFLGSVVYDCSYFCWRKALQGIAYAIWNFWLGFRLEKIWDTTNSLYFQLFLCGKSRWHQILQESITDFRNKSS